MFTKIIKKCYEIQTQLDLLDENSKEYRVLAKELKSWEDYLDIWLTF